MATLTPVDPPEAEDTNWSDILEAIARDHAGQWIHVAEHGFAKKSIPAFLNKVKNARYAAAARVGAKYDGTFDTSGKGGEIYILFTPN